MNDMHAYDRFLFSLVTKFTRRAQPHLRSLWADVMELEAAANEHVRSIVRQQTMRRLLALGQAARAVDAREVQALSQALGCLVTTAGPMPDAAHDELFEALYQKMRELTKAVYAIQPARFASEREAQPTETEFVESCVD